MTEFFPGFFAQIWRYFQLETPFFGLSVAELWLGAFAVSVSVRILNSFFGLGKAYFKSSDKGKRYERKGRE